MSSNWAGSFRRDRIGLIEQIAKAIQTPLPEGTAIGDPLASQRNPCGLDVANAHPPKNRYVH